MMLYNWKIICPLLIVGLVNLSIGAHSEEKHVVGQNLENPVKCLLDAGLVECLSEGVSRKMGEIESESIARRYNGPAISTVVEESLHFLGEFVHDVRAPPSLPNGLALDQSARSNESPRSLEEEARKKKFGKKKKKHLQKLLGLAMLLKAKISLLLQLISTHFQLKFFVLAIVNLILNAAKFWLDLKKSHPAKVIYYEHAQHQHHYDHDDHDSHSGYWARSANSSPTDHLAYSAYKPTESGEGERAQIPGSI